MKKINEKVFPQKIIGLGTACRIVDRLMLRKRGNFCYPAEFSYVGYQFGLAAKHGQGWMHTTQCICEDAEVKLHRQSRGSQGKQKAAKIAGSRLIVGFSKW